MYLCSLRLISSRITIFPTAKSLCIFSESGEHSAETLRCDTRGTFREMNAISRMSRLRSSAIILFPDNSRRNGREIISLERCVRRDREISCSGRNLLSF